MFNLLWFLAIPFLMPAWLRCGRQACLTELVGFSSLPEF